jgi:hypothetical protein
MCPQILTIVGYLDSFNTESDENLLIIRSFILSYKMRLTIGKQHFDSIDI